MASGDQCHERPYIQQVHMGHGGAQTVKLIVKKKLCKSLAMGQEQKNTAEN